MVPRSFMGTVIPVLVQFLVLVLVPFTAAYTLDLDHSLGFRGPPSSMFGYSVLLHRHKTQTWLVAGAPVANSSSNPSSRSPGAVFRCNVLDQHQTCQLMHADVSQCGKTCEAESDYQWLGVSLSRQPGQNGHILACAHRWKNVFYSRKDQNHKLPNGVCYRYGNDLSYAQPIIPCYRDHQRKFGEDFGSCQAGISNVLTEDLIIMGAPGTTYWTGSVLVYNTTSGSMAVYLDDNTQTLSYGSYLGYSVAAGHFLSHSSVEVVGGAPQYNQRGKVYIFSIDSSLKLVSTVSGTELGSYFGSSVCAVDLNSDGLSDLLVGAPMATGGTREEGRVHVYLNQGESKLLEAEFHLTGSDAYAARFGEAIADLGDLDDDGYHDVAVGAPQEDELRGAIYIYNGRHDGIRMTPSQRITGSMLGRDLRMFGQSLSSGVDIDGNGYQDVAIGAFLSDSAVILRSRPVVRVEAVLVLPEQVDQQVTLCREHNTPTVCFNVSVCFSVSSRQYRGIIDLQYNLTSDLLHKPSFPHRFYFHGNGSSNSTMGRVRARPGPPTCISHLAIQRKDVRDIFTPIQFQVSYGLRESHTHRSSSRAFPPLKPLLQQGTGLHNRVSRQTRFTRSCFLPNCSTDLQLSAQLILPQLRPYFALGSTRTIMLNATVTNAGDHAFLPRLLLRFPSHIHYVRVVQMEDTAVTCDLIQEVNSTVGVACGVSGFLLPAHSQLNVSFLFDVSPNSTAGGVAIYVNIKSDNYENEAYLHDNGLTLMLPLKYEVDINIHGFVSPTSFVFGDEDVTPVECFNEKFNYTYKVLNSGQSRSVDTVVEISLPKTLTPYRHRLLQVIDWQSSQGVCSISDKSIQVINDCDVPQASFIKQLVFFFSYTATRIMFCGPHDFLCERLVCRLGNLEAGRVATIQLDIRLNPAVLRQAPGRHGIMLLESTALMTSPREEHHTTLIHQMPMSKVVVEAVFTHKPPTSVQVFIIVVSLVLGLSILSALICCLWKAGFFRRSLQKKGAEHIRDSWDYVPKVDNRESTS